MAYKLGALKNLFGKMSADNREPRAGEGEVDITPE